MSAADDRVHALAPGSWWRRLHGALLPDYNRKATVYWFTVALAGALTLGLSLWQIAGQPVEALLQVAVGAAIAMLAGFFPVRIGQSKNSFAAGEIFIFLLLLVHGPAAATLAAAGEGAMGSWRTSKRASSRIISPLMSALAMYAAGSLLQLALQAASDAAGTTIVATVGTSIAYFVLNTLLVSTVPRLKRNEPLRVADLFGVFGWVGIAYAGSATVSALLYLTYTQSGLGVLMAMVPLLATMLAALHYFFRQQEAAEAARQAGAEAAERERDLARRHVRELEASERRFHNAFEHASIGMALLSFDGRILQANPALQSILGCDADALVQRPFQDHVVESGRGQLMEQLGLVSEHEFEAFSMELRCRRSDGAELWVSTYCNFFSEHGATTPCLILQVQDISARRKAEEGLHQIAFHDSLTGLPNRRRFLELLDHAVQRAQLQPADAFAVMFLDFDRFKLINDSLGHSAGDEFLVQVSRRIQEHLRQHDVVARLGGDEFAVLAQHLEHEGIVVALAERIMETMRKSFVIAGTELTSSVSIGITFSALGYTRAEDVLRDADIAMYKAKGAGKARYALFDTSLHTEVANRLRLEGELRRAIDDGQLSLAYQPLFSLRSGRLTGFEALVRWQHPVEGAIHPGAFLPIAEEAGLMQRLSDFVLHCACHQLRAWQQLDPSCAELTMNVNISGQDISHGAFAARVTRALVESGLQARHLCLELTENILMARIDGAIALLHELRRLGVRLAIDDFGTGYSSLSHLSTLPIDTLKIDRSFVARMSRGSDEAAVVRSVILLGSSLGKSVVAEGIEHASELAQLREMGCGLGQGFHLARPMSAEEVGQSLLEQAGSARFGLPHPTESSHAPLLH